MENKDNDASAPNLSVGGSADESVVLIGNNNQIKLTVQNYAKTRPSINQADLLAQLDEYLNWMRESYGSITLRGIEEGGRQVVTLPLESVYVPLQAEYDAFDEQAELSERDSIRKMEQRAERSSVKLNEILSIGSRLIISGGPGSGKTTVLQHVAWTLAASLQGQPALARQKLGLGADLPLPIYAPLSLYASYLRNLPNHANAGQKSLATFISEYLIQRQTNLSLPADFLAHLLREAKTVLLLLDGLDEVPNEDERANVRQAIEDLVGGRDALRVVVTSRTAAYRGQAVLGRGFKHIRVLSLESAQIEQLVRHAYDAIHPQSKPKAQKQADDLLADIARLEAGRRERLGDDVESFVNSPLMVRMLLIVHFNNRSLPDQRADLYQKAVDAMLRPDYALDQQVTSEIEHRMAGSLAVNREMLQLLAWHMHSRGREQGREIDEEALKRALCAGQDYAPEIVEELLAQTRERGTLLEERGGLYRFIHLSFQEFLVGRYLALILHDPDKIAEMLESGPALDSWWREPVLLMIGYLDANSPSQARPLLLRLAGADAASEKRAAPSFDTQLACAELAAAAALECRSQPASLREALQLRLKSLHHQAQREKWTPAILASALDALDHLGYQPDDLYSFVEIFDREIFDGGRKTEDGGLGLPSSVLGRFFIARYPVTNAQYARFLQPENFENPDLWTGFPKYDENGQKMEGKTWGREGWKWLQSALEDEKAKMLEPRSWRDARFGQMRPSAPVVGISWHEANAYCKWLRENWDALEEGKQGLPKPAEIRLPTEVEWVTAAGGEENKRFAWGNLKDEKGIARFANTAESRIQRTTPVWMYPQGESHQKVMDMSGNVWEWQANFYAKDHNWLALRGGSWYRDLDYARGSDRNLSHLFSRYDLVGFRVLALPM